MEGDSAARLSIEALAELVFEDPVKARRWLKKPLSVLDEMTPVEAAQTERGAEVVRGMLAQLALGGAL